MSSINLQSLRRTQVSDHTYKDIHLDIKISEKIPDSGLYRESQPVDILESLDVSAIKNSISNIFNTSPGEKLLNPEFGADLSRYLFNPMTKDTAENIGESTRLAIETFETRVTIDKIQVIMNRDAHEYIITINLSIPSLNNKKTVMTGILTSNGYKLTQ